MPTLETQEIPQERNFEVVVTPCIVTKQFDRCIRVNLAKIEVPEENGETRTAVVQGAFSRAGLQQLLAQLEAVPDPIGLKTNQEIREGAAYMWGIVDHKGEYIQQYSPDGSETLFSTVHIPDVQEFWIIPRHDPEQLPWYGLSRQLGWLKRDKEGVASLEGIPEPPTPEFWFQYYRRNTLHFSMCAGETEQLPPHIVQVLGWRVGEQICEIGVEEDGSWQIWQVSNGD